MACDGHYYYKLFARQPMGDGVYPWVPNENAEQAWQKGKGCMLGQYARTM